MYKNLSTKRTAKERVFQILKERIMRQEFRVGDSLSEAALANALGVSRTPIREAILQLQREGLVEVIPNRGAFVTFISLKDLKNIIQLLQILEGAAVEMSIGHLDMAKLDVLEAEFLALEKIGAGISYNDTSKVGIKLHELILETTGNERIFNTASQLREQMRALSRIVITAPGRVRVSNEEHLKILRALKAMDTAAAKHAAIEHLTNMYKVLTEIVV
jgi:DNA-binding GntR family transcriptional regulator